LNNIYVDPNYINFLSTPARQHYFDVPNFTDEQKRFYFDLSQPELEYLKTLSSDASKLHYILLSGYFHHSFIIFSLEQIHIKEGDISFIRLKFQLDTDDYHVSRPTINKHQTIICELSQINQYKPDVHRSVLIEKAAVFARIHIKPIFVFTEIIQRLLDFEITMPSYREFQIILSTVIHSEEARLINLLRDIPKNICKDMEKLLESDKQLNLASIITAPKNTSNKEIDMELMRLKRIEAIYEYSKQFIPKLELSSESIKYYSSLVKYYGRSKLNRMQNEMTKLYIICYINYRYQKLNDNLVDALQALVSKYHTEAISQASAVLSGEKDTYHANEKELASVLSFYTSTDKNSKLFSEVRKEAFKVISHKNLKQAVSYMSARDNRRNSIIWKLLAEAQKRFKKNIRRIFLHLNIASENIDLALACEFIKSRIALKKFDSIEYKLYPKAIIPEYLHDIFVFKKGTKKHIDFARYEFLVYLELTEHLTSGDANVSDSTRFKSFEQDQLDLNILNHEDFKNLNLPILNMPIEAHLNDLKTELEERIKETNENIAIGINQSLKIKNWDERKWTLPYIKQETDTNDPIFEKLNHINIVDVVNFVQEKTNFLSSFTHILPRNTSIEVNLKPLNAALIAKATNHGIYRMSKISDMTYETLKQCTISMICLENVRAACNILSNKIQALPIFKFYNIGNLLHGGIDGQKFKTKRDAMKARTSAKYYHLGKSVSSGTLLINHVPANAKLFGSNEHESRFVFDLVYNNKTEIQPDIISTDSHGSNAINFALLHLIGRDFAPCFKKINNKETMISGFEKPAKYKDFFLRPSYRIKPNLIIDDWDNVKRILASLALKNTTQSVLIRKLCSTPKKNKTKEALWEYDKIIRSIYLLRYIDDEDLRVSVRTALNRTEAYHQLKRFISSVNSDALIGADDDDLDLNDECTRLLCLVVIYYNAYILSEIFILSKERFTKEQLEKIKHISLIAWGHINFHGYYSFNSSFSEKALKEMIEDIIKDDIID
jgi:TnpA family transposase